MQESPEVNIYIETDIHGPSQHGGRYMYLLEYVSRGGRPVTRQSCGEWTDCKETELVLLAAVKAFGRMRASSVVDLYTSCRTVRCAVENGWLDTWAGNGWVTAKGRPVRHARLWGQLEERMRPHLVFACGESHRYRKWMQGELRKHYDSPDGNGKAGEMPLIGTETGKIYI